MTSEDLFHTPKQTDWALLVLKSLLAGVITKPSRQAGRTEAGNCYRKSSDTAHKTGRPSNQLVECQLVDLYCPDCCSTECVFASTFCAEDVIPYIFILSRSTTSKNAVHSVGSIHFHFKCIYILGL